MRKYFKRDEYYEDRYKEYEKILDDFVEAGGRIHGEKKSYEEFLRAYYLYEGLNRTRKIEGKYWKSPFEQIVKEETITYSRKQAKGIREYLKKIDKDYKKKYQNVKIRDIRHGIIDRDDETKFWEAVKARQSEFKEKFSPQETRKPGESLSSRVALEISHEFFGSVF